MKTSKLRRYFTPGRFSSKGSTSSRKVPAFETRCPISRQLTVSDLLLEKTNAQKTTFRTPSECKRSRKHLKTDNKIPNRGPYLSSGRPSPQDKSSFSSTGRSSSSVKAAQKRLEGILARCRKLDVDHRDLYSVSLLRQASADSLLIPTYVLSLLAALSFILVVVFSGNLLLDDLAMCRNNSSQVCDLTQLSS